MPLEHDFYYGSHLELYENYLNLLRVNMLFLLMQMIMFVQNILKSYTRNENMIW